MSLANLAFALYQFRYNASEAITTASIEITRKYLSDPDVAKGRVLGMRMLMGELPDLSTVPQNDANGWNTFVLNAGYISELLIKERLARDYLTATVLCDIWLAKHITSTRFPNQRSAQSALFAVGASVETECRSTFPTAAAR